MAFRIVTLGDSITWGQGLLEDEKFDSLVKAALAPTHVGEDITIERSAHSGAIVSAQSGDPQFPGEVPESSSIPLQCDNFNNAPEAVDLVILDGGINDVGVATILNPLALIPPLQARIESACHDGMLALLHRVTAKFTKEGCKIVVLGYYTIFSKKSDPLRLPQLLEMHGITSPRFISDELFANGIVARCEQFFNQSTDALQRAVSDAGDPRITFVPSGFTDENAIFAPASLLWGLTPTLSPEDPVAAARHLLCDAAHPSLLDIFAREKCDRASVGHPNLAGAKQYANQITAVIGV